MSGEEFERRAAEKRAKILAHKAAVEATQKSITVANPGGFMDPAELRGHKFSGGACPRCGVRGDTYVHPANNLGKCRHCDTTLLVMREGLTAMKRDSKTGDCNFWRGGAKTVCNLCGRFVRGVGPATCGKTGYVNPAAKT